MKYNTETHFNSRHREIPTFADRYLGLHSLRGKLIDYYESKKLTEGEFSSTAIHHKDLII